MNAMTIPIFTITIVGTPEECHKITIAISSTYAISTWRHDMQMAANAGQTEILHADKITHILPHTDLVIDADQVDHVSNIHHITPNVRCIPSLSKTVVMLKHNNTSGAIEFARNMIAHNHTLQTLQTLQTGHSANPLTIIITGAGSDVYQNIKNAIEMSVCNGKWMRHLMNTTNTTEYKIVDSRLNADLVIDAATYGPRTIDILHHVTVSAQFVLSDPTYRDIINIGIIIRHQRNARLLQKPVTQESQLSQIYRKTGAYVEHISAMGFNATISVTSMKAIISAKGECKIAKFFEKMAANELPASHIIMQEGIVIAFKVQIS